MATYDVTALSSVLEFDTTNASAISIVRIPGVDRVAAIWTQSTSVVYVQAFNVNKSTGAVTAIGSPVDIDTRTTAGSAYGSSIIAIDGSNLAVFWVSGTTLGYCRLISVDGSGNLSTNGSELNYDNAGGKWPSTVLMDSTHILASWGGSADDGMACIFTVNTGTGSITKTGTQFEFNTTEGLYTSLAKISATKAVVFYAGASQDGFAIVLSIDTSTWAVTAGGASFEYFDATTIVGNSVALVDISASPVVAINGFGRTSSTNSLQSFQINTSTWAITAFGARFDISAAALANTIRVLKIDATHFICLYRNGTNGNTNVRTITLNASTGEISNTANTVEFATSDNPSSVSLTEFTETPGLYVCAYTGLGTDGFIQAVQVTMPTSGPANLKTYNTNPIANIKTINTNNIANVKTLDTNA